MFKIYTATLLIFIIFSAKSQVGVGTVNPNAALDILSTNDGLLIPRISLTATNVQTIITPTVSELVYNTNTSAVGPNQVTPGFYYWDGASWIRLSTSSTSSSKKWDFSGNSGTDPSIDFIGTSDAEDLVLRTDNTERIRLTANGNVGITESAPGAKLEVLQDQNFGSSLELNHNNNSNTSSAAYIRNSGSSRGLHVVNLNPTANAAVARFYQAADGNNANGINIDMDINTAANSTGLFINQGGAGFGEYIEMTNSNSYPGLTINHLGTGIGISNIIASGNGILNDLGGNSTGITNLLDAAGGTGSYTYLAANNGTGSYVLATDNTTTPSAGAGGDVFAYFGEVNTNTAMASGTVSGAVFGGNQYGVGHGIYINHSGTEGRGAEFNITNASNTDSTIYATHSGSQSVINAQSNPTIPVGQIIVAEFEYVGTHNFNDHIGVRGTSTPAVNYGVGVNGTGNFYGVFSNGNLGATGTKTFLIDHPKDPTNKMLKHFSIESNEVLNMYRGVVPLDSNGVATIKLPEYFDLININFSYQLTAIGTSQNPYVLEEIDGNQFKVGGAPNTKVSWTVYANRNDAYMQQNPEEGKDVLNKKGPRKGKYISPELYGQPDSKGMFYVDNKDKKTANTKAEISDSTRMHVKDVKGSKKKKMTKSTSSSDTIED